ncbi:MAG: hypothetical protein U0794_06335 [Isosphaeraceae bacterium]
MAHQTEAACLLDAGALYGTRLLLKPREGDPIFAGFKSGAFSLYYGDAPIFHFDLEGRWQRVYVHGRHYLKGLDSTIQAIDREREGKHLTLHRRTLGFVEGGELDDLIRATALDLLAELASGRFEAIDPPPKARALSIDELVGFLERISSWNAAAWFSHRERFLATYRGHLPLLPPDCTAPVVLQATCGSETGSVFGGAVDPTPFESRTVEEFESHAKSVARLLGRRVAQCKQIVLAGADVLRRPTGDVAGYLQAALREFPAELGSTPRQPDKSDDARARLDGVHAFLDRLDDPGKNAVDWRTLATHGLVRVTLGIESGDPDVRAAYGKTWNSDDLIRLVQNLKAASIGVGVLLLVGAGGVARDDEAHAAATADLVNALPLGAGDLVSLLDAHELSQGRNAAEPVSGERYAARLDDLRMRLAPLRERQAKVAPYLLSKQGVL